MKKFSRIVESYEFLGWSADKIVNDFKSLDPVEIELSTEDFGVVEKDSVDGQMSTEFYSISDIIDRDLLFHPCYTIMLGLGKLPEQTWSHLNGGNQTENWAGESISYDLISDEWYKLNKHLEKYKEDFHIFVDNCRNKEEGETGFYKYSPKLKKDSLIRIKILLVMKDSFDKEHIRL